MKKQMKKMIAMTLSAVMALTMVPASAFADTEEPASTWPNAEGVYEIYDAEDLADFAALVNTDTTGGAWTPDFNNANANAKLMNDIDFSSWDNDEDPDNEKVWNPIGNATAPHQYTSVSPKYEGIFDGNGKTISNFDVSIEISNGGLFGTNYGTIKNLTITGSEGKGMTFNATGCAAIAGKNYGLILGCVNKSCLNTSKNGVGGICFWNYSNVVSCANMGDIASTATAATVANSIGGLVGRSSGNILHSYNSGSLVCTAGRTGGLVGTNTSTVKHCYNVGTLEITNANAYQGVLFGNVTAASEFEGNYGVPTNDTETLAGTDARTDVTDENRGYAKVTKKELTADKLGSAYIDDDSTNPINNGYPVLTFQKSGELLQPESEAGLEFVSLDNISETGITVTHNKSFEYYELPGDIFTVTLQKTGTEDVITAECDVEVNGTQLNFVFGDNTLAAIEAMKSTEAQDDAATITVYCNKDTEDESKLEGTLALPASRYWHVYAQKPAKVKAGDKNYPQYVGYYKITKAEELTWFAQLVNGELAGVARNMTAKAFLANDIALNEIDADGQVIGLEDWGTEAEGDSFKYWDTPIGIYDLYNTDSTPSFKGTLDGNGHAIRGMYSVEGMTLVGFLNGGEILNVDVEQSLINKNGNNRIGGIVEYMKDGTVQNCRFAGTVNGSCGIVGTDISGTIEGCINAGTVVNKNVAAGIALRDTSSNSAKIINCYNVGTVSATSGSAYGIGTAGNNGDIIGCYNAGSVTGSSASYPVSDITRVAELNFYLSDEENADEAYAMPMTTEACKDGTLLDALNNAGGDYAADTSNANNGYPVLSWQSDLTVAKKAAVENMNAFVNLDAYGLNDKAIKAYLAEKIDAINEASSAEEIDSILAEITAYMKDIKTDEELRAEYAATEKEAADLEKENQNLQQEIDKTTADIEAVKQQNENKALQAEIDKTVAALEAVKQQAADQSLQAEIDKTVAALEEAKKQAGDQSLQAEIDKTAAALEEAKKQTESQALQAEINSTVAALEAVKSQTEDQTLQAEIDQVVSELDGIAKKLAFMDVTAKVKKTKVVYSGKATKPAVTVKAADGTVLKKGTDYTLTYKNNKAVGTATVIVKGQGGYDGEMTLNYTITPKKGKVTKVTSAKKGTMKVKWQKRNEASGYEIMYGTQKKLKKGTVVAVKKKATVTKTFKKLKSGKKYYVKVRAYKTVNGQKIYGNWSVVKQVKVK